MLTGDEARRLDRLAFSPSRTASAPAASGLRHARSRGLGIEFQDYRHYQPGDDPRAIDWTVEARLQQLVVRVTRGEAQLRLHLMVDVSGSMAIGQPTKLSAAARLAAALCYLAVEHRDAVGVATFATTVTAHQAPVAGRPQLFRIFEALRAASAGGRSDVNRALREYATAARGPGLVVVLSDFFQPTSCLDGLGFLLYRGFTPAVIQVVAAEELRPDFSEELALVDIEDAASPVRTAGPDSIAGYRRNLAEASAVLGEFCSRHGLPWLQIDSSWPFERQIDQCREAGLIGVLG